MYKSPTPIAEIRTNGQSRLFSFFSIKHFDSTKIIIFFLILVGAVFYFSNLGLRPLEDYDEAVYGKVVEDLWLAALSAKLFGLNEFALRVPSAVLALFGVVFVYLIIFQFTRSRLVSVGGALLFLLTPPFL